MLAFWGGGGVGAYSYVEAMSVVPFRMLYFLFVYNVTTKSALKIPEVGKQIPNPHILGLILISQIRNLGVPVYKSKIHRFV